MPCNGNIWYEHFVGRYWGASLRTTWLPAALTHLVTGSEHTVNVYMEHNGIQCFGVFDAACQNEHGMWLYQNTAWSLWGWDRPAVVESNKDNSKYYHIPIYQWSSFKTTSGW
jgi:hypothetical protein